MHLHSDFVPLHLHTEYSLLDGAIRINELVEKAKAFRMPALAMTDHGNLFGAVEFYKKVTKAGIKPVIGCEVYVAPGSRLEKGGADNEEASFHLILLARDNTGYKNLVSLVTKAYLEGFYYKPRIDMDLLEQYSGGLIGLSACLKGEIPYCLQRGLTDRARERALQFKHILGPENFYIEIQENGMPEQAEANRKLIELARELHIGIVATNDCHYLKREDAKAHEVLLCIQTGKTMKDANRMKMATDEFYFKSPAEMKEAFKDIPEAIANTVAIAERCNVEFTLGESLLPRYKVATGESPDDYLTTLARNGLEKKFSGNVPNEYSERLRLELEVIRKMGYASYFLIVWDFISFARNRGIPVGPGRGSAAGSLVSYCIGITEIDPLKYNLLFERFLNSERISMPDIDVDFCQDRRGEVISYVSEKYGKDRVAQIITFGTMAAKAAIRDVGRAMDMPYAEVDKIAKLVPNTLKITIEDAIKAELQLKAMYESDAGVKELLNIAMRLEGLNRHASTHAAGVIIAPVPLTEYTPLYKSPSDESIMTQFDMGSAEGIGLLKFDFLGLKTLTVIQKTLDLIRQSGREISLQDIPLDDRETYELLSSGQTTGIFQLESAGMKDILVKMGPNRFEDLIALVALYRPGPLGSGMIDDFIKRKKGKTAVKYDLPQLKEVLDETYGVILYQEQVMRIANKLANFSLGQADILRKAMGKKNTEAMAKQKEIFVKGALGNGISEKKAAKIFDLMEHFAEYGFNKSHSAAYAYVSFQTAYLKTHYPVEFMAATLSADMSDTDKIVKSINECRKMRIEMLPPDINLSAREFMVIGNSIRFGLEAVKGVGGAAIESIIEIRSGGGAFKSIADFVTRVDPRKVNKKVLESLVKAGAFDSLGVTRAAAMKTVAELLNGKPKNDGQQSIFGEMPAGTTEDVAEWEEAELLSNEKEALGFYITGHPLARFETVLKRIKAKKTSEVESASDREDIVIGGVLRAIKKKNVKSTGDMMAYVSLEDDEGSVEVIIFSELYKNTNALLKKDALVLVKGNIDKDEKGVRVRAREVSALDNAGRNGMKRLEISLSDQEQHGSRLKEIRSLLDQFPGDCQLYLRVRLKGSQTVIATGINLRPDNVLISTLEGIVGRGGVSLS
ncbi:DNA polymerase III alpha subunit [Candidatus Sulfobium mesophilum]|uniref:DNA polymerase III subunit alpha n=1 Tax=Candidatus Sulfobium mesophilum TaxID=2016548 RepID=A0A2U3QGU4_9BACT|nr:DNA polymerase III alpha subunit [Candidatus Sulfobium mesophilum]